MRQLVTCIAAATAFVLMSITATAQKPNIASVPEIKLAPENESSRIQANMRVLDRTGYPVAIYYSTYRAINANPETQARQYLSDSKGLLGLTVENINALRLQGIRTDETGSVVRLRQTWKGLPVNNNAEITVHISPGNIVDFVMNGFQYGITLNDVTPVITSIEARQRVMTHLNVTSPVIAEKQNLMILHHQDADYLVYRINFYTDSPMGEWDNYVDAKTGALLKSEDVACYHHAKDKKQKPVPAPYRPYRIQVNGTGNTFDPDPLTTATATYGGSYVDGSDANAAVLTAQLKSRTLNDITFSGGIYSLVGPYAEIRDFEAPAKGLFTQATSTFNFDRNADAFEAVNCYYHIDAMMRYINTTLGLTIMPYHYVGGVRFDPSGLSGADNSHYLSGNGQLAFGEGGVDDAEDADVVIHELGHGIHDWVTLGGLSQVNGLSEGSGDYIAGSYSRNLGYWTNAQAAYNYTFNWDGHNPFWAGRVLNYAPVYPGGLLGGPGNIHIDGQIWATANMKIWDDIGRQKADKIFWRGLGLTNSASNQNDAANAVYAAASLLGYSGVDRLAIYNRFTAAGYTLPAFVLPVKLVSFEAKKADKQVVVSWTTASEENTSSFVIERSVSGNNFSTVGTVTAAGNSTSERTYSFINANPVEGNNYYRLRTVNIDNSSEYSKTAWVLFGKENQLQLFPNPVYDVLTIKNKFKNGTIYLYDLNGKQVFNQKISNNTASSINVQLPKLPAGLYVVKVDAEGRIMQGTIVKE